MHEQLAEQGNSGTGLISYEGKEILPAKFNTITPATVNGKQLWRVMFQDGNYFYIDETGKCVVAGGKECRGNDYWKTKEAPIRGLLIIYCRNEFGQ